MSTKRTDVSVGDQILVLTAGGGGYGDPKSRDSRRIEQDILDEFVSLEVAKETYGYEES
jgi:N-methylhydantoinase B